MKGWQATVKEVAKAQAARAKEDPGIFMFFFG
jgi:hypothetical protein